MKSPSKKQRRSSQTKRRKSGLAGVPTPDQWKAWKRMQFCSVNDPRNDERITFCLGEDILVLNHDWRTDQRYDMWDAWVGKIVDIRGNSPRNTWVIVRWYFSGKDIAEHEPAFLSCESPGIRDTSCYGKFERSLSQDRQFISSLSINGKATVIEYDEKSSVQEPIPPDCFYTRRSYNSLFDTLMPTVDESITCICGGPYHPDDSDPMRFCPRFGCRRWFHESCLHENGHILTNHSTSVFKTRVSRVPPDLLRLACAPIIKGGPAHGVVGNVKSVCEARQWAQLYSGTPWSESRPGLLLNGITLDRWLDGQEGIEVEELIYPDDESGSETFFTRKHIQNETTPPPYSCPSCRKPV
ncbi:hypothetical protein BJV74DRAFT_854661 [Russula compacta]|nr:hypothetical protein BJV74DRAFT_854661 [Russula compacta]